MVKNLWLVRGLPGSGKTTLAKRIVEIYGAKHYEVDMWMVNPETGLFVYDAEKVRESHIKCRKGAVKALRTKGGGVVISNTMTLLREMLPYFKIAYENDAIVHIMEPNTPWSFSVKMLVKHNTKGISETIIRRYKKRWFPIEVGSYKAEELWRPIQ